MSLMVSARGGWRAQGRPCSHAEVEQEVLGTLGDVVLGQRDADGLGRLRAAEGEVPLVTV